jgi:hypothetical protein
VTHIVVVVDRSGSMNKKDVAGYLSRTHAVYECLATEFLHPQLDAQSETATEAEAEGGAPVAAQLETQAGAQAVTNLDTKLDTELQAELDTRLEIPVEAQVQEAQEAQVRPKKGAGGSPLCKATVSLLEMSDETHTVFARQPLTAELVDMVRARGSSPARSHGNYLPAMEAVRDLLLADAPPGAVPGGSSREQVSIVFLSDGAPSDHQFGLCQHGVAVWERDVTAGDKPMKGKGKGKGKKEWPPLNLCSDDPKQQVACRLAVTRKCENDCLLVISDIGKALGRDRVRVNTVAFGAPGDNYSVLERISNILPSGSFHKLSLSALKLSTTFSTLSTSLTSLRTSLGSRGGSTNVGTTPGAGSGAGSGAGAGSGRGAADAGRSGRGGSRGRTLRHVSQESEEEVARELADAAKRREASRDVYVSEGDGWYMYYKRCSESKHFDNLQCGYPNCDTPASEYWDVSNCCSECMVQRYCSQQHQLDHRAAHAKECEFYKQLYGRKTHDNMSVVSKKRYDHSSESFVLEEVRGDGIALKKKCFAEGKQ